MTNIDKFKEQCARPIIYKSECPDLMKAQCIKEKFDGDKTAYKQWVLIMKHEEKNLDKMLEKDKRQINFIINK